MTSVPFRCVLFLFVGYFLGFAPSYADPLTKDADNSIDHSTSDPPIYKIYPANDTLRFVPTADSSEGMTESQFKDKYLNPESVIKTRGVRGSCHFVRANRERPCASTVLILVRDGSNEEIHFKTKKNGTFQVLLHDRARYKLVSPEPQLQVTAPEWIRQGDEIQVRLEKKKQ